MTEEDKRNKNLILIEFLKTIINDYKIKAEYSTNDKDINVIVVQESSGQKDVFFDNNNSLYNYFNIEIFGDNIKEEYETANKINDLIGQTKFITYKKKLSSSGTPTYENQLWQIIFKQYTNPRAIEYYDIRRVSYTSTYQLVVNRVS